MDEDRELFQDIAHGLRGPHFESPADFTPLRLCLDPEQRVVTVQRCKAILGRHTDADVRVAHAEVSRRHCLLAFDKGAWRVYDLSSLNGVFVNDERVVEAVLYAGDCVRVGPIAFKVESATPARPRGTSIESQQLDVLKRIADHIPKDS